MKFKRIAGIVLFFIGLYGPILYVIVQKEQKCDEIVFLEGELSMDVRGVDSYDNGMSTIHLCDGTTMRVPTRRIIKIVNK